MDGGKRPEQTGGDDEPFGLRAVRLEVVGQPAHPSPLLVIHRWAAPKGHDVSEQLITDLAGKNF